MPRRPVAADPTRADALGRIAAKVSDRRELTPLFHDIIDEAFALFGVDRAGLWTYDASAPKPLRLAAQRGLPQVIVDAVDSLPRDAPTAGMDALRSRRVRVLDRAMRSTTPGLREVYQAIGVGSVCFVPLVYGQEALGLLVLYHRETYGWTRGERALARAFGDQMATAVGTARLAASRRSLAERLSSIAELTGRLSGSHDRTSIAAAIVEEAKRLIVHDNIRVYHVDHVTGMCEPIAFEGTFLGSQQPDAAMLRMAIGTGLTGWVAANAAPLRLADATGDPRALIVGARDQPESMLLVPMVHDDAVRGVIVVSALGTDRYDADDEITLSIFAAAAIQALVNAENVGRLRSQQAELELQLEGQRRLLDVNERLLSTLDPNSVLELIADSLRAIVPYDSLTVYRVDREAGVRRAVIARDKFAEEILAYESPIGSGITGWVIEHGEAVLANDAHVDDRSVQIPNTPFEPESIVVVPLLVNGEAIGTLNVGRLGNAEAHFTPNEFELTKLFAGQASIAMQNALTHREVRVRADQDSLTGLRNHGAFQRELRSAVDAGRPFALLMMDLDAFKRFNDTLGHPAGDSLLIEISDAMQRATRDSDRLYRYGGDEFAAMLPGADRVVAHDVAERIRRAVRERTATPRGPEDAGPAVTISAGIACFPSDGRTTDELVAVADRALYLVKPERRANDTVLADPYLRALDETALALLDRSDPDALLSTILSRASALLGTPHAWIDLVEPDARRLVMRVGTGICADHLGESIALDEGIGGEVARTGLPLAVDDYDAWSGRVTSLPSGLGATIAAPLQSAGRVIGVLGLAAGSAARAWSQRDLEALASFARLAAIGLENARLVDVAQRGALYDPTTGLPNRELLSDRIAHALAGHRTAGGGAIGVILLDLDRFKVINETLGHVAGDRLLMAVAQRLIRTLRPGDTVARFGGDEFAVVLDPVADADEAQVIAGRIATELGEPLSLHGREWFVSASMGIAIAEMGRGTPEELLREAEIAMVRAKGDTAHRHLLFEPSMSMQTLERVDLETDLRQALDRDELRLHYQPIVSLASGEIVGIEALVRWQHPTRGLVPPLAFIPLAEETGLILPLGRWVLEEACHQAASWNATRTTAGSTPLFVSVNLSARQFTQGHLVEDVAATLLRTGLDAGALELEITESVLMDQSDAGVRALTDIRGLGVRLVLDDFGTGYSSLSYLKHLPLDTIKVDRTFVVGLEDVADRSIVDAVIALAHGLGIGVVAEGIETEAQEERLRELGCDLGQGYLFSRPIPADEIQALVERASVLGPRAAGRPLVRPRSSAAAASPRRARSDWSRPLRRAV